MIQALARDQHHEGEKDFDLNLDEIAEFWRLWKRRSLMADGPDRHCLKDDPTLSDIAPWSRTP